MVEADGRTLFHKRRCGQAKTLYLPHDVIAHIDSLAEDEGVSFSQAVARALRKHYGISGQARRKNRIIRRTFPR